jgi:hypothetical protein
MNLIKKLISDALGRVRLPYCRDPWKFVYNGINYE